VPLSRHKCQQAKKPVKTTGETSQFVVFYPVLNGGPRFPCVCFAQTTFGNQAAAMKPSAFFLAKNKKIPLAITILRVALLSEVNIIA
jgi:hypothetical protein